MRTYKYATIAPPDSAYTIAESINNSGEIVGFYQDSAGQHGFVYDHGVYTTIDPPGSVSTIANSFNASGQIVGQ